jgi:threonine/homoserine/homoserine lactone efflux protein
MPGTQNLTLFVAAGILLNLTPGQATSANAFLIVKMAGAAYLTYLGPKVIFHRTSNTGLPVEFAREDEWSVYRAGFLSNLLNPKVALFFMAFLPQFVSPSAPFKILAFLFLGALFMTTGTIWCLALAWFGAATSRRLRENPSTGSRLSRVSVRCVSDSA